MHNLRAHILTAAYPLFAERGIDDVTEEDIREAAHVSQQELIAAFPSKSAIAAACMIQREREWTIAAAEKAARARGATPEARLLSLFDVLEEWFQRDDEEGKTFLDALVNLSRDSRIGRPDAEHLAKIRATIAGMAREAGLRDPDAFALTFHVLIKGCVLSALEGDTIAGVRARDMGRELIAGHRRDALAAESALQPGTTWFGDPSFDFDDGLPRGAASSSAAVLDWYDDIELGREQQAD
ncbi:TetR/AcrR family transcriptional regulator [Naasia sp. SYSU D00057]|uniref:TetR/AcrR family transcriptional regulator n=1 Tax=Naasia sp. SYSU D00057 TaxID=2817380 RepID=UPI001B311BBA|nr:TetR/AcrR family transcriptional regulator [Naasia sp. SYSU D00057]